MDYDAAKSKNIWSANSAGKFGQDQRKYSSAHSGAPVVLATLAETNGK